MKPVLAAFLAAALVSLGATASAAPSGYKLTDRIDVTGDTWWEGLAFDPVSRRLVVPQRIVTPVIDVDTRKILGAVQNTEGPMGVALAPDQHLGFTADIGTSSISVFDLGTLKLVQQVKAERLPRSVFYDTDSKRVLVMNKRLRRISALDTRDWKTKGSLDFEGAPGQAVTGTKGRVFVNIDLEDALVAIDPVRMKVVGRQSLPDCHAPYALTTDPKGRIYSVCRNGRLVVSSPEGKPFFHMAISKQATAFGIGGAVYQDGHLFVANGRDADILVIDETSPDRWDVVEIIPTERGARGLAGDPEGHRLFTVTADVDESRSGKGKLAPKANSLHVLVLQRAS